MRTLSVVEVDVSSGREVLDDPGQAVIELDAFESEFPVLAVVGLFAAGVGTGVALYDATHPD